MINVCMVHLIYETEKGGARAKQQRKREGERKRDGALLWKGYSAGNKLDNWSGYS